jgi:transposase
MDATKEVLQGEINAAQGVLYMALELSVKKWKTALSAGGTKVRQYGVEGGDRAGLLAVIEKAKQRFGLGARAAVVCCYEAGRDGFWVDRFLSEAGIENKVVDSSSIEVKRRQRRAKTDRLDAGKLLSMLVRDCRGEKAVWQVLRVPTREEEDARRMHRELESLKREHTRHTNRIGALLALHGLRAQNIGGCGWGERLKGYCRGLGANEAAELERESARLALVRQQLREVRAAQEALLKTAGAVGAGLQILRLARLCGIGVKSAWTLFYEFFWRRFNNRREVGSCAGLTGTPYQSGESRREQGISKAGNKRVRCLMVELAWSWLRYQAQSDLSRWYRERFAGGGVRLRRIGIVALARRLLIAIWRYLEQGLVPAGARQKAA